MDFPGKVALMTGVRSGTGCVTVVALNYHCHAAGAAARGSIHYSTAKVAMITLTKSMAKELAPYGIRVNAVSPGVIATPDHEQFSTPEAKSRKPSRICHQAQQVFFAAKPSKSMVAC